MALMVVMLVNGILLMNAVIGNGSNAKVSLK